MFIGFIIATFELTSLEFWSPRLVTRHYHTRQMGISIVFSNGGSSGISGGNFIG